MKTILNVETGETLERELTSEEMAQQIKDEATVLAKENAKEIKETAKIAAYEKLGLTAEEIKAILS